MGGLWFLTEKAEKVIGKQESNAAFLVWFSCYRQRMLQIVLNIEKFKKTIQLWKPEVRFQLFSNSFVTFSNYIAKIQSLDLWEISKEKSEEGILQNNSPFSFLSMVETR